MQIPWSAGIEDYNAGLAENTMIYKSKDFMLGDIKYFGQRPSITYQRTLTNFSGGGSLGRLRSVVQRATGEYLLGTSSNLFNYLPPTATATEVLSGGDATDWTLAATNNYKLPPISYQKTDGTTNYSVTYLNRQTNSLFVVDSSTLTYTRTALGFNVNQFSASLDGYLFVALAKSDTIYNSDLNVPTTYNTAVNLIRASQYPGNIIALARMSNYIVALKQASIEFFYNAGLTSTSPLQRNTSLTKRVGCVDPCTVAGNENTVVFAGQYNGLGDIKIFFLSEEGIKEISTPLVEEKLKTNFSFTEFGSNNLQAYITRVNGKVCYIITNTNVASTTAGSLVYDFETGTWSEWKTGRLNSGGVFFSTSFAVVYPTAFAAVTNSSTYNRDPDYLFVDEGVFDVLTPGGTALYLSDYANNFVTKDYIHGYSVTQYLPIPVVLKFPTNNYGTMNRKFLRKIGLSGQTPSNMEHSVEFTKLVGYNRQTITQSTTNSDSPNFHNWGSFVYGDIVYTFRDPSDVDTSGTDATLIRFDGVDLELSNGIS